MRLILPSATAGPILKEKDKICIAMTNNSIDKKTSLNSPKKRENVYNLKKTKTTLLPTERID